MELLRQRPARGEPLGGDRSGCRERDDSAGHDGVVGTHPRRGGERPLGKALQRNVMEEREEALSEAVADGEAVEGKRCAGEAAVISHGLRDLRRGPFLGWIENTPPCGLPTEDELRRQSLLQVPGVQRLLREGGQLARDPIEVVDAM
jgi:hypothetical protein